MISEPHPLDEVLARTDAMLYAKTPANCYATAMLVRIDGDQRALRYANAGHPPGYLLDCRGTVRYRLDSTGQPLGCLPEGGAGKSAWHALDRGDTLVLVTDGILEAASPEGEFFGEERVLDVVRQHLDRPAQAIAEAVQEAIGEFCRRSQDDATIVVMKVTGSV
jgi:serine phosphatase RsbU (regulator of sigma subunit)